MDAEVGLWADIQGQGEAAIALTRGVVSGALDVDGAAQVRCTAVSESGEAVSSDPVEVTVGEAVEGTAVAAAAADEGAVDAAAQSAPEAFSGVRAARSGGVALLDAGSDTYTVTINYSFADGATAADPYKASLPAGSKVEATVTFPTVQGYLPYVGDVQMDSYTFGIESLSSNVTVDVVYKPAEVDYTVAHYQQNVGDDKYTVESTETKQGETGSTVPDVAKSYDGFYSLQYERPAIAADGSTKVNVYYDRYYYLMKFDMDGGYGTEPVYARYGAEIGKVATPVKAGYTFVGWSEAEDSTTTVTLPTTMPAASKTYHAVWEADDTAKVTVVFWGENADDEKYSYLSDQTKEIQLKPGREFTYTEGEMLVCDKDAHTHADGCLSCGKTEHTHSALGGSCYTLTCTTESHTHGTSCYAGVGDETWTGNINKPGNPSEGQVHEGRLGTYIYIKGTWYDYTGSTASGSIAPTTCGKQESNHTHTNSCYSFTCTAEEHTHGTSCYSCGKEAHSHNTDCYMQGAGLDSKLWKFVKSDTITVAADGSSVCNVYYDRVEYSVQFYNGSGSSEYTDIKITAKWGASIGDKWPTKNNSGTWAVNPSNNGNVAGPYQVYLQQMPVGGDKFYGPKTDSGTQSAYYYVEVLPGETGTATYNGKSYKLHHTDTSPGTGYVVTDDDKYAIQGFTFKGFSAERTNNDEYRYNNAKFYYDRNSYNLTFNDGYSDVKKESVKFEAPLSTYKDYVPEVPSAYEPGSVVFGGWYQNPQCTGEEYKLEEHKMPANDVILYAKWVPVKHTVTFYLDHAAYENRTTLNTHPAKTVDHGSLLEPAPSEPDNGSYKFVGWFYEENGVEKAFDFESMEVRKDLHVYGKWTSDVQVSYTVKYVLQNDHSVKVADDFVSSGLAGSTKTLTPKTGEELYEGYTTGCYPVLQSQSVLLDPEAESITVFFEYKMEQVSYTVHYVTEDALPSGATSYGTLTVDGKTYNMLQQSKVVDNSQYAVVTESAPSIDGFTAQDPTTVTKTLTSDADQNVIVFYYKCADTSLKISKTVTDLNSVKDGETFVFTVTGDGLPSAGLPVVISGADVKSGNGTASVTIEGLKVGSSYTVVEDGSWSWRYTPDAASKTSSALVANPSGTQNTVTFTNKKTNDKWLDFSGWCRNLFGANGIGQSGHGYQQKSN